LFADEFIFIAGCKFYPQEICKLHFILKRDFIFRSKPHISRMSIASSFGTFFAGANLSMLPLNITPQEFSTPFQIAAHLEIPGLPQVTHPALAGLPTPPSKKKKVSDAGGSSATPSATNHIYPQISEFDLWLAALSV
jgi:hypothetical protein